MARVLSGPSAGKNETGYYCTVFPAQGLNKITKRFHGIHNAATYNTGVFLHAYAPRASRRSMDGWMLPFVSVFPVLNHDLP